MGRRVGTGGRCSLTGLMFGIAQQSRGAHFVSHDLWSAFLVWMITLSVYAFAIQGAPVDVTRQDLAGYR